MARAPVLAAGGIVLRQQETPLVAVVRLRKRNEWVLPKGKLDDGETPRDAAEREVLEETGHEVSVHEFLGTLVYESGGRFKVVHYWRMEAGGEPSRELMDDVRAVDWLPLDAAVERLTRSYERAFLENVGPLALEAAALARKPKVKKQSVLDKRRRQPAEAPQPSLTMPVSVAPEPGLTSTAIGSDEPAVAGNAVAGAVSSNLSTASGMMEKISEEIPPATFVKPASDNRVPVRSRRINLMQKVRDWLRRAA
ncbi:MAG: NUDIX hydrolase [Bradyrhizobium sp.]|nr:NUDIX hydrolase [Bradyrhizobium sp.]THD51005.1 MAG: NUDIX hydrolase [Bradyrhizobium sp.]